MNIIEKIREILNSFPHISEVCNEIHVDFTDPEPTSYGLSSTGDQLLSEDVLGGQKRQHSFMLYSTFSGINDYERLGNSEILLELSQWLDSQTGATLSFEIDGKAKTGKITKISADNGMLYSVPQENEFEGLRYQLQIIAEYETKSEDL